MSTSGSVGKWWIVVRGEKCDIDAVVGVWDRIYAHCLEAGEGRAPERGDPPPLPSLVGSSAREVSDLAVSLNVVVEVGARW